MTSQRTPASAQELLSSLRELRSDPIVAAALRGEGPDGVSRVREASPTRSAFLQNTASVGAVAKDLEHVAAAQQSQQFYRMRDAARESTGVRHWVQKHREEVDASELRRVENRLKAEKLFAQSQMDVERLRLDAHRTSQRLSSGEDSSHIDNNGSDAHNQKFASEVQSTGDAVAASVHEHKNTCEGGKVSRQHDAQSTVSAGVQTTANVFSSKLQTLHEYNGSTRGSTASVRLDTDEVFGPIDVDKNYAEKAAAGDVENSRISMSPVKGENMVARYVLQRSPAKDEIAALREAVDQRNRTIHRLEKQLGDDREYYELEIQRLKSDAHEERLSSEGRVTALRSQIDQLIAARSGRNVTETTVEELTMKLQTVQRMYRESVEDIKRKSKDQQEMLEQACECRIREITERCEAAIRTAKAAFLAERSEFLATQKTALVESLQREQSIRMRECEDHLRDSVYESVRARLFSEIETTFRKYLDADIIPAVHEQMRADVRRAAQADIEVTVTNAFSLKTLELQRAVHDECKKFSKTTLDTFVSSANEILCKAFVDTTTQSASRSSDSRNDALVRLSAFLRVSPASTGALAESQVRLQAVLDDVGEEAVRQEGLEELHVEKASIYRRRIAQAEESLQKEKEFVKSMEAQLESTSVKRRVKVDDGNGNAKKPEAESEVPKQQQASAKVSKPQSFRVDPTAASERHHVATRSVKALPKSATSLPQNADSSASIQTPPWAR